MHKDENKPQLITIGTAAKQLGKSIDTLRRWDKKKKLTAIRIGKKGTRHYKQSDIDFLLEKPLAVAEKWVETKQANEPLKRYYCGTRDIFQARLETMQSELKQTLPENEVALLTAISGEIGNNSYDHNLGNWIDIMGIFFAYSLAEKVIVLADRGQGVLTTLKRVKPELSNHEKAVRVAFTERISGRHPENRGNGLKFVKQVVTNNDFSLTFRTGDAILNIDSKGDDMTISQASKTITGCLAVISF